MNKPRLLVVTSAAMNPVISYSPSLTRYERRLSRVVQIGEVPLGGHYPIRVQSMTTVDTMDTMGSVAEVLRMVEAGCEYVRITAPSVKEAHNLAEIKKELRKRGCNVPLIADIHFTPNAAELAARIVEKVRINPGNYADKKRFENIEYNDITYQAELDRIRQRFEPLVKICKEHGTAMRIGTNHGSLSDRILSRYGDTPLGMVESALEFLRICNDLNYHDIVLSMKASNAQVMVQAYRLLVQKLEEENLQPYPLHLGVTEAGEAEDGRIKSALGIGTLLEDGLGDTVRVSLTEPPENEAPVALALVRRYESRTGHSPIPELSNDTLYDPFHYSRRITREVHNLGGGQVPRVIADLSQLNEITFSALSTIGHPYDAALDKFHMDDQGADYIYTGRLSVGFMLPNGLKAITDYPVWLAEGDELSHPLFSVTEYLSATLKHPRLNFISVQPSELTDTFCEQLEADTTAVLLLSTENEHAMAALRAGFLQLMAKEVRTPVIIHRTYASSVSEEQIQLFASTDAGGLLLDGMGDGILLTHALLPAPYDEEAQLKNSNQLNQLAFGILQAARTRMSKTEYISCPSCGRTLFDLPETTAMIRKRTDHLKGVKIGIMGCIVNGPGEMADADYGYVGVGKDKIALYRGQQVVKKAVPASQAVDELINLIREDARWVEPRLS